MGIGKETDKNWLVRTIERTTGTVAAARNSDKKCRHPTFSVAGMQKQIGLFSGNKKFGLVPD